MKICGITRLEDLEAAEAAGADAIGLNLVDHSPRKVTLDLAAELAGKSRLPAFLLTKDLPAEQAGATLIASGASGLQPYGEWAGEAAATATELGFDVIRPTVVGVDLETIPADQLPLFDQKTVNGFSLEHGFDYDLLPRTERRFVVAGRLTPETVGAVIARCRPFGVDVAGGVEDRPGIKNPRLIEAFVSAAKGS